MYALTFGFSNAGNSVVSSRHDYVRIWNGLPEWAGTADSPILRAKIMEKAK